LVDRKAGYECSVWENSRSGGILTASTETDGTTMPILAILTLAVEVACCIHVVRTRREYWWIIVILLFPWVGAAVYVVVNVIPDMRHGRAAKQITADVGTLIDPDKDYRQAVNDLEEVETVETLTAMAEQLVRYERYEEAITLLQRALTGVHEHDPETLIRLAEAQFLNHDYRDALATLDRV
jgi:hypothetical protein